MTTICLRLRQFLTLAATAAFASFLHAQDVDPSAIKGIPTIEGKEAPEIQIDTWINLPDGKQKLTIADFKGKVLVMMFFMAEGMKEGALDFAFAKLKDMHSSFQGNDKVAFIACLTPWKFFPDNTEKKLAPMAEKLGIKIPMGHFNSTDLRNGMVRVEGSYHVLEMPWVVVVGTDGIVKFSGNVNKIDPATAKEKITEMLK